MSMHCHDGGKLRNHREEETHWGFKYDAQVYGCSWNPMKNKLVSGCVGFSFLWTAVHYVRKSHARFASQQIKRFDGTDLGYSERFRQ